MDTTVSLIIPAYNEEERIVPFLSSIKQYQTQHPQDLSEILVIDDGSTDATSTVVQSFQAQIPSLRLVTLAPNQGKGAAVQRGVRESSGSLIIFMDADGATSIEELPKMLAALHAADIGVGNRWQKQSQTKRSSFFRHLAGWTNRTYMRLLGLGDIDTMCGFKGYRRQVAQDLFTGLREKRWLFDTEIAYKSVVRGYRTQNFPIAWQSIEGSKLSRLTLLKTAFEIWPLIRRIKQQEASRS